MSAFFRKNSLIGAAEIGGRLPLIFTAGYLAQAVGPEAYGNWVMVVMVQGVLASLAGLGLSSSISRLAAVASASRAHALLYLSFRASTVALLMLAVLLFLIHSPVAALLNIQPGYQSLLPLAALLAAGSTAEGLLDAYFKSQEQVGRQALFIFARTAAEIIAVVSVFVFLAPEVSNPSSQLVLYSLSIVSLKLGFYLLLARRDGSEILERKERQLFLTYGLPLIPNALLAIFISQGDRMVLSQLVEKEALGSYAFGATLASYVVFIGYAVYPLLLPRASRHYESGEHQRLLALFREAQQTLLILLIPTLTFVALFSRDIILITAGAAYGDAATALLLLSVSSGIDQLLGIHQYVFHLVKRPRVIPVLTGCHLFFLLTAVYVAASGGEIAWVPWAVLCATLAFNLVRYAVARRYLALPVPSTVIAGLLIALPLILWLGRHSAEWDTVLRVLMFAVIAAISAAILVRQLHAGLD